MNNLKEDLAKYFPYKIITVDRAEGDDIIGTLCKWSQENELSTQGLFSEPQKIMIVSSDGDFKQLHKYPNVKQFSPMQKKSIKCSNPKDYLMEHIVKAGDDGIPNILSADDTFVKGERQKPVYQKVLDKFIAEGFDACENDLQRARFHRNQRLVDLDFIPEDIVESIIDSYTNQVVKGNKASIMNYLIKHRCRLLLDDIEQF